MIRALLGLAEDEVIEDLIKPPVPKFTGFDWSHTGKLVPTGEAHRDKIVSGRLQPTE